MKSDAEILQKYSGKLINSNVETEKERKDQIRKLRKENERKEKEKAKKKSEKAEDNVAK